MPPSHSLRLALLLSGAAAGLLPAAEVLHLKQRCLQDLVAAVPAILQSQNRTNGQFGKGIWIVTDQNVMFPLAAAWSWQDAANPYHNSREVLDTVMAAGDALIADADERGRWEFRKKDGSTWGKIFMPWTYSRWLRAYLLIRGGMPPERREKWEKALRLGFTGIAAQIGRGRTYDNIYAHHAMALYYAGQAFDNPAWRELAARCLHNVIRGQNPAGYWAENVGPVVAYSHVYLEALALYYTASHDQAALDALRKAVIFHTWFTYPDGSNVETVDDRNPYHGGGGGVPNLAFTLTPEGRTFFVRRLRQMKRPIDADSAATLLLAGEEGPTLPRDPLDGNFDYILGKNEAAVRRRGPWFLVLSAYTAPPATDASRRWWMDRQNLVSVYHDKTGLILGGGNSKLQPYWSTFTIGDTSRFHFMPAVDGKEPDFLPPPGLRHIPTGAKLVVNKKEFGLDLDYGGQRVAVRLKVLGPNRLEYKWSAVKVTEKPLVAHATIYPRYGEKMTAASGRSEEIGETAFRWPAGAAGAWLEHAGFRLFVPRDAVVHGPETPWNPYTIDGRPGQHTGLLVVDLPVRKSRRIRVEVQP